MQILIFVSNFMIPLVIFYIVGFGILMKRPVYDDFVNGAKRGITTVFEIMPTLVGLMMGVGILRASGFLDVVAKFIGNFIDKLGFPAELVPVAIVKLFSSSAATGLALDIFKQYGPDSRLGIMTSIMLSCTETVFYTMSVYFLAVNVKKTRHTLAGSLLATIAGMIVSVFLANMM